ncbi:MAG: hypothetical protein ACPHJ3_14985 [Rubripirellula sp.]
MLNKSLNEVREIIAGAISAPNNINTQQDSGSVQKMRRESHRKIAALTLPTTRVTIRNSAKTRNAPLATFRVVPSLSFPATSPFS